MKEKEILGGFLDIVAKTNSEIRRVFVDFIKFSGWCEQGREFPGFMNV